MKFSCPSAALAMAAGKAASKMQQLHLHMFNEKKTGPGVHRVVLCCQISFQWAKFFLKNIEFNDVISIFALIYFFELDIVIIKAFIVCDFNRIWNFFYYNR